jgi:hypothetical protein
MFCYFFQKFHIVPNAVLASSQQQQKMLGQIIATIDIESLELHFNYQPRYHANL